MKKISLVALCIVIMLVSCGCWDYISLNELAIELEVNGKKHMIETRKSSELPKSLK